MEMLEERRAPLHKGKIHGRGEFGTGTKGGSSEQGRERGWTTLRTRAWQSSTSSQTSFNSKSTSSPDRGALIGVNEGQEACKYCRELPKSDYCNVDAYKDGCYLRGAYLRGMRGGGFRKVCCMKVSLCSCARRSCPLPASVASFFACFSASLTAC